MQKKIYSMQFMDNYFPLYEGVTICMHNYALYLNKLYKSGIVCPKINNYNDDNSEFKVYRLNSYKLKHSQFYYILNNNKQVFNELMEENLNVLHVHSPFRAGRFALKLAKNKKIPIIATFHTKFKEDFKKYFKSRFVRWVLFRYSMNFFKKCDEVWTVNNATAKTLKTYGYKGNVRIVPNGTDFKYPADAKKQKTEILKKHGLESKNSIFLFVGRLHVDKGIMFSLEALKEYKKFEPNFKFIIVGSGKDETLIKNYVRMFNLTDNVIFTGKIMDRNLLQKYYLASDLFLFPSAYDTDGLTKKEAASNQLASILLSNTNAAEGIEDSFNGYLIDNNVTSYVNKIIQAVSNKEKLKQVGINASKTVSRSWENVVRDVYEMYDEVIQNYKQKSKHKLKTKIKLKAKKSSV